MNRPALIEIQNAEIRTAAVEIRTLLISGKQVTLAVFRQIKQEKLVNQDGSLNGVPWGIVNYHPDSLCHHGGSHWHIVWQRQNELRRATVFRDPHEGSAPLRGSVGDFCELLHVVRDGMWFAAPDWPAKRAVWASAMAQLATLPQLFIAV